MHILIADDHANVRRGLREILTDAFSCAHFSEAANGDEVLAQLARSLNMAYCCSTSICLDAAGWKCCRM